MAALIFVWKLHHLLELDLGGKKVNLWWLSGVKGVILVEMVVVVVVKGGRGKGGVKLHFYPYKNVMCV